MKKENKLELNLDSDARNDPFYQRNMTITSAKDRNSILKDISRKKRIFSASKKPRKERVNTLMTSKARNRKPENEKQQAIYKEYLNVLSVKKINFEFDEYGDYIDDNFQPSIFFFKFLTYKPDYEKEKEERGKPPKAKLKLYVPDTIILNDLDTNYWIYTDLEGYVVRVEEIDSDVIEKFRSLEKDDNELIGVSKLPIMKDGRLDENQLTLLNMDELEKCLFSKSGSQMAIQRYIKCRGPKAFVCRSVWRRDKPPYLYILTNKANYHDEVRNQNLKYVVNSRETSSYSAFYSTSGKHLEETMFYMNNIVKFIENHSDIILDELAGDFVKDEAGIWWFINLKAMKVKNLRKFRDEHGHPIPPQLSFFMNQRVFMGEDMKVNIRKFDYQNKIKCKLCGIDYSLKKLKYSLTTKMILETDKMVKHVQFDKVKFNVIDRPDLKHTDYSMIYLPYRVCEDCYLLFEALNNIKNYQIEIANLFRNPVNKVNFGFGFYAKEISYENKVQLTNKQQEKVKELNTEIENLNKEEDEDDVIIKPITNRSNEEEGMEDTNSDNYESENYKKSSKKNNLYRILIMFNDIIWSDKNVKLPDKDLFLVYTFLGNQYKIPIKMQSYTKLLDYSLINFNKIYHIICTEPEGFIKWVEKNRYMEVKIGYFETTDEEIKKKDVKKLLRKDIVVEDEDICDDEIKNFVSFASVDLSTQGLKYGTNYRNNLNGLLFKKDDPHYVGKLRCIIRIHKVREIQDINKYNLHSYFNLYIPPVNFVMSDEMPDYWIEIVERQKLRENALNEIFKTMEKYNIQFDKKRDKKKVLQCLESLVSYYAKNNA